VDDAEGPAGYSLAKHCELLCRKTGATTFKLLPAKKLFALGVGTCAQGSGTGSKSDVLADAMDTSIVELSDLDGVCWSS
jgi:hypothetical protein